MRRWMKRTNAPWRIGYHDGSGPEYIVTEVVDDVEGKEYTTAIATVRWGCDCCKDQSPLTDLEKETLALIAAIPKMLAALEAVAPYQGLSSKTRKLVDEALKEVKRK